MIFTKKYALIPVNLSSERKKIVFNENGKTVYDVDCRYSEKDPDYLAYVEIPFKNADLHTYINNEEIFLKESDTKDIDGLFEEELRPEVHFTVEQGWNNDPNGLIYYDGLYHMFFQYNPCEPDWGNMQWGHAVSDDLLHFEEKGVALFPDKTGTMFSGSAIEKDGKMILFYTAAGSNSKISENMPFEQYRAVSENGFDFVKSEKPVIRHIESANRDPKVVYSKTLGKYLCAIYLEDNRYCLFTSPDLEKFEKLQVIEIPGEAECPDIMIFERDGKEKYAVMGASDKYIIGNFDSGKFTRETGVRCLCPSDTSYAGQSISGLCGKVVRIDWHRMRIDPSRFTQEMSFPFEIELKDDEKGLRLVSKPIDAIKDLYQGKEIKISDNKTVLDSYACDFSFNADGEFDLSVFGNDIHVYSKKGEVRMITDRASVEIWYDGYEEYRVYEIKPKNTDVGFFGKISKIIAHPLKNIHI